MNGKKYASAKRKRLINNTVVHVILAILAVIWVFPILWVILTSFRAEKGSYVSTFFPQSYTLDNYIKLFTDTTILNFPQMFMNTLFISICSCILATFYTLAVSYCLSRLRFRLRKPYMNMAMILGLFPGFMSMIAVYFILKALGLTEGNLIRVALILVYSGGAGLGFQIAKGFFDTIPFAIDEAALLDGCTRWQIFSKITLPLSKPIIIYTVLTAFMSPLAGFHLRKGNLPCELRPVHGGHRSVEDAGEGIHRQLVHQLRCRCGADFHPHRHSVSELTEVLRGRCVRSGEGLMAHAQTWLPMNHKI